MAMSRAVDRVIVEMRKVADEKKDYRLLKATLGLEDAYTVAESLLEERRDCRQVEAGQDGAKQDVGTLAEKAIKERISKNRERYKTLLKWRSEESDEDYKSLYRLEIEALEIYAYMTVAKFYADMRLDIGGIDVSLPGNTDVPAKVDSDESRERSRKNKATRLAKDAVGGKGRDKLSSEEEIQTYDDAWNEAYTKGGGADESAMNPARRYSEEKERKAQKEREEEDRKAQKEREEEERKASEESEGE